MPYFSLILRNESKSELTRESITAENVPEALRKLVEDKRSTLERYGAKIAWVEIERQ